MPACPSCGADNPDDARLYDACGERPPVLGRTVAAGGLGDVAERTGATDLVGRADAPLAELDAHGR